MKTFLDWSAYEDTDAADHADTRRAGGNFANAIGACVGSRQCEAQDNDVMCPSYRVTGDPALSTGGRARLLKAALAEDAPDEALASPELMRAMASCIGCKGCKRECENAVDMTRIRIEYRAQLVQRRGLRLRDRLFAKVPRLLYSYPWIAHAIRWRNRSRSLADLSRWLLGIHRDARLPEPASAPFVADGPAGGQDTNDSDVVLFVDTFTRWFEPDIARAALDVLRAAGLEVIIATPGDNDNEPARPLCCGRTYLDKGLIEEGRAEARRLVAALLPHVRAGRSIVGLEPSCLIGLREDYPTLGLGPQGRALVDRALLLEEFLAKEALANRLSLPLRAPDCARDGVGVHAHCHQRAADAVKFMRRVLKLIPGQAFDVLESGCCGMAGTFGLEAENGEMATGMAELALLPGLRERGDMAVIANGFSCREQIQAHTGRRPRHLAEFLRDALAEDS